MPAAAVFAAADMGVVAAVAAAAAEAEAARGAGWEEERWQESCCGGVERSIAGRRSGGLVAREWQQNVWRLW